MISRYTSVVVLYRLLLLILLIAPAIGLFSVTVSAFKYHEPEKISQNSPAEAKISEVVPREARILVISDKTIEPEQSPIELEDDKVSSKSQKNKNKKDLTISKSSSVFKVPFYSQFNDISQADWKKVGCGIASLAMLISFYEDEPVSVDGLLKKGISDHAYLDSSGWIHSGLINLSHEYGLDGVSRSVANLKMPEAFSELEKELETGPVMASVHYTFEPTNPIPHLVVVNGVADGKVFYNDPAEENGGGSLSIDKFQKAWKKRYISIRPIS